MAKFPQGDSAPTTHDPSRPDLRKDASGRVYLHLANPGRSRFPEEVPIVAEDKLPANSARMLGARRNVLDWPAGTVAYIAGPRIVGLTVARWLATELERKAEHRPARYMSARSLPSDRWDATPGIERTLIIGDVTGLIGRPRLAAVGSLLGSRGGRSMILAGDPIGTGEEWEAIARWLQYDSARMVSL